MSIRGHILIAFVFLVTNLFGQNIGDLKEGMEAPSLYLNNSANSFHSSNFSEMKKIVYIQIWDLNNDSSDMLLSNVSKLEKKYGDRFYKTDISLEIITVCVGKNFDKWTNKTKDLSKVTNYISVDGFWEVYVQRNKINKVPYSLLIDEKGLIVHVNVPLREIENYLRSTSIENKSSVIAGKLLIGSETENLAPLTYRKIYVTDQNNDTIQSVITNQEGNFEIKKRFPSDELSLNVSKYPEIAETDNLFLATQTGKIISNFVKSEKGFSYRFLKQDIIKLIPLQEEDPGLALSIMQNKVFYTEYVFAKNKKEMEDSAKWKLDVIVNKLIVNPSYEVQITSHTDKTGNPDNNLVLSQQRAQIVSDYLVSKGIKRSRINAIGVGDKTPLFRHEGKKCTQQELDINRRVEFKIIK